MTVHVGSAPFADNKRLKFGVAMAAGAVGSEISSTNAHDKHFLKQFIPSVTTPPKNKQP
jgi:hypothetical protein